MLVIKGRLEGLCFTFLDEESSRMDLHTYRHGQNNCLSTNKTAWLRCIESIHEREIKSNTRRERKRTDQTCVRIWKLDTDAINSKPDILYICNSLWWKQNTFNFRVGLSTIPKPYFKQRMQMMSWPARSPELKSQYFICQRHFGELFSKDFSAFYLMLKWNKLFNLRTQES